MAQSFYDFKSSYEFDLLLARSVLKLFSQTYRKFIEVNLFQKFSYGFRPHSCTERVAVRIFRVSVLLL